MYVQAPYIFTITPSATIVDLGKTINVFVTFTSVPALSNIYFQSTPTAGIACPVTQVTNQGATSASATCIGSAVGTYSLQALLVIFSSSGPPSSPSPSSDLVTVVPVSRAGCDAVEGVQAQQMHTLCIVVVSAVCG